MNVNLDSVGRMIAPPVPRDIMIIQTVNLVIAFQMEQSKYRTLLINYLETQLCLKFSNNPTHLISKPSYKYFCVSTEFPNENLGQIGQRGPKL